MCRWLAYSGSPIRLEELLVKRDRSLIDQSLHSRLGATTTNGDGFGVGWYDEAETPRLYRSVHPAWNDRNLRELAAGIDEDGVGPRGVDEGGRLRREDANMVTQQAQCRQHLGARRQGVGQQQEVGHPAQNRWT